MECISSVPDLMCAMVNGEQHMEVRIDGWQVDGDRIASRLTKQRPGRLMDGADDGAACVDNVSHCAHDDGSSACIKPCRQSNAEP